MPSYYENVMLARCPRTCIKNKHNARLQAVMLARAKLGDTEMNVQPGQRVITSQGNVVTIAFVRYDTQQIMAYEAFRALPVPVRVCADACGEGKTI